LFFLDSETLSIPSTNCRPKLFKPNLFIIFSFPLLNLRFPSTIYYILLAHSFAPPSIKNPHYPSFPTDYLGPPLLSAITGTLQYIASHGTIPKCSFVGV